MPDELDTHPLPLHAIRIGHGYDLHVLDALAPEGRGKPLVLGGVAIEHDRGPVGHSDGDAALHAVTDALLGAIGEPDIGQLFSDTEPQWRDADSSIFLAEAVRRLRKRDYVVGNIDITVICEQPKVGPHKPAMIANIAELLACDPTQVNIKGKTHEGVDAVGQGRAIEVHAVALVVRR